MNTQLKVLIIEDKPADFRLIVRHLEKHGLAARCHCVADSKELEAAVEQGGWDAVLSDYSVPTLEFQDTLGVLQARHPDVPVILVSGSVGEERAVELLKLGVWDFVLKDNLTRLVPAIERSLRDVVDRRERQVVEAALRESEKRHRTILQTAMDGFWLVDMQGRLLEVNETYCRMSGYSAPELLAMRISDLEANEASHDTTTHTQKIVAQGEDRFESRHRRKDGSLFAVEVSAQHQPVAGGRMVVFLRNITERKRAEAALKESEAHYRALVEGVPGIVYSFSSQRGGLYYSSHVTELLGYSPEQLYAQPRLWNNSIHPDDLPRVAEIIREVATGKLFRFEYRIRDARGNWRWFDDRSFRCQVEGAEVSIEGLALDITERKRAEELLRQQAEELLARNDRLNRFNQAAVGRELRMIELKREANELCGKLGEPPRHRIVGDETVLPAAPEAQA